ncbi:hypothetical protein QC762_703250 [Podospora pseudocomata]|uniref:Ubiquitin 3 binding protein But2 C-terminal domain-containing protein n=1 Tax=Podospora pseudocomata TaxID=2093779 RepID=A0ABR0G2W2_9PEZI|nr:hypothetical protein QC762_703250 [Podospora pseudocomata]
MITLVSTGLPLSVIKPSLHKPSNFINKMQFTSKTLLSLAAALSVAAAQSADCVYDVQSAPFHLRLTSDDARLNDTLLVSVHAGPPYRQLVSEVLLEEKYPGNNLSDISINFYYNTTSTNDPNLNCLPGKLHWAPEQSWPSVFGLESSLASNVLPVIVSPTQGEGSGPQFDEEGKLFQRARSFSPVITDENTWSGTNYYKWFVCATVYGNYNYGDALTWVSGGLPDGKDCRAVNVTREWA